MVIDERKTMQTILGTPLFLERNLYYMDKENTILGKLLASSETPVLELGELIEGNVISIQGTQVFVDLKPHGTGIIYGKEYLTARDMVRSLNAGDTISAKIVELENEDGYIELSLKEAKQALAWGEAEEALKGGETLEIIVKEANKGGLMLDWNGISGFLPASQLNAEHYPRVESGDKDAIVSQLKKLVGQKLSVNVLSVNPKEGKLIFSEKGERASTREKSIPSKYSVGDTMECEVTGIVDFGIFLKLEEGVEGLVHISEMAWSLVENPRTLYKVGDKVKAQIIEIKDGKISFSIKALTENPWTTVTSKYEVGQKVSGVVIKHNKHGALVSIEQGVAGLVHISEFESEKDLKGQLQLGQSYEFAITTFEPKDQKLTLSFKA
ncbi:MAG: S1 RNA-binding domain-containing protein [Candidatus Pacebacteria bacterium]|nr:S1 RNA-binding domain-containing protein [Candidatus Paceibacterota bacterium]